MYHRISLHYRPSMPFKGDFHVVGVVDEFSEAMHSLDVCRKHTHNLHLHSIDVCHKHAHNLHLHSIDVCRKHAHNLHLELYTPHVK